MKAQTRARRPGLGGLAPGLGGPSLRVAVTAAPEDGRANEAIRHVLAVALSLPLHAIALRHGAASRDKSFHLAGDTAALIARLESLA